MLLIVVTILGGSAATFAQETGADAWQQFRQKFPYHIQTVAISSPTPDGQRAIIISEPPPSVTLKHLQDRFGDRISGMAVRQHGVGVDGWVKDVAGTLSAMSDAELDQLVGDLNRDLFGTSYKAHAWIFDRPRNVPHPANLDLSVSAAELRSGLKLQEEQVVPPAPASDGSQAMVAWIGAGIAAVVFLRTRRRLPLAIAIACVTVAMWTPEPPMPVPPRDPGGFIPLHGGDSTSLKELMRSNQVGVFLSDQPGVVALLVSRSRPLNESVVDMREFALDSDLIVGAVGDSDTVAIMGRERSIDVATLPPLRTETLLQLAAAAAAKEELAQSYERTFLLAGRYQDEPNRDWAPIYLSKELHDTEYGSLLNITDQMLKAWSQHGTVEYANFDYPKPRQFPFDKALSEQAGVSQVTFNWNTRGVGYVTDEAPFEVLAFTRTGSLPVDYLGDKDARLRDFEDTAYAYFAGMSDPNLVRVVQYAGIYQIWKHFGVTATYASSTRPRGGAKALQPIVEALLETIRDADVDVMRERDRSGELTTLIAEFEAVQSKLERAAAENGPGYLGQLAEFIASPREMDDLPDERLETMWNLMTDLSQSAFVDMFADNYTALARAVYQRAEGGADPDGWIKTPSVVVSWSTASANWVGGHNLSSRISSLHADATLPAGQIRVVELAGQRRLYYSPADSNKIQSSVRTLARSEGSAASDVEAVLRRNLSLASGEIRPLNAALRLGARDASAVRGMPPVESTRLVSREPWRFAGEIPSEHATALGRLNEAGVHAVVIERVDTGFVISQGGRARVINATDSAGALDAVAAGARDTQGRIVHLHFKNVNTDQARAFSRSMELHTGGRATHLRASIDMGNSQSLRMLGELRQRRWKWSEAEIKPTQPVAGPVRHIEAEIIVRPQGLAGEIRLGVKVAFRNAVEMSAQTWSRIQNVIARWLEGLSGLQNDVDLLLASRRLMQDLKAIDPMITHVETRISHEAGDLIVVEHDTESGGYRAD